MSLILKALIALVIGVVVAFIVGQVCKHFGFDLFYGWLAGIIAGLLFFFYGSGPNYISGRPL